MITNIWIVATESWQNFVYEPLSYKTLGTLASYPTYIVQHDGIAQTLN